MDQYVQINQMYWESSLLQYIFYASTLLIIVLEKNRIRKIIFGIFPIVMIVCMFNPLTFAVVDMFFYVANVYFVRLFSVVPVFYCISHAMTLLLNKAHGAIKLLGVCVAVGMIVLVGNNVYREPWIQKAENLEKVPQEVLAVLETIPRQKDNINVAFPDPLLMYARQVDGSILMPYGRRLDSAPTKLQEELDKEAPDVSTVMALAGNQSVDYVVVKRNNEAKRAFERKGYEPIGETSGYLVYPVTGVPRNVLVLNEKRQIRSVTACDADGNPTENGTVVITKKDFEYDRWGNMIRETYFDKSNQRVTTVDGYSGILRTYKLDGLSWTMDSVVYVDNQDHIMLFSGRYETRPRYITKRNIVEESYYDLDGTPMNRLDTGYSATTRQYDGQRRILSERFTDASGNLVLSTSGYAGYSREYDETNHIRTERYYDTKGRLINSTDGFAEWTRTYDDMGDLIEETFLDKDGCAVDVRQLLDDLPPDLLQQARKQSVSNSVGIRYKWNEDGSCTVQGRTHGITWNTLVEGERPYYFLSGKTYKISYASKNVVLRLYFYDDQSMNHMIGSIGTTEDTEFNIPRNCEAMIIRLWVAPGTTVNETVYPRIMIKEDT